MSTPVIRGLASRLAYVRLLRDPIGVGRRLRETHGPLIVVSSPNRRTRREELLVLAFGHEFNRVILSDPSRFRSRGIGVQGPEGSAQQRIRVGLITMNADEHSRHRKLVKPPFLKQCVDRYQVQMVELTRQLLDTWVDAERRDIHDDMRRLSLWITTAVLFGDGDREVAIRIGELLQRWLHWSFSPAVILFPVNVPGTPYRRLLAHAEVLETAICDLIGRRNGNACGHDVLSMLMGVGEPAQQSGAAHPGLAGQTAVLFGAAHETLANALTWTLFLLSQHPEVTAELVDELDAALSGSAPRIDQLDELRLLDRVIKESLRLLPPVSWGTRIVDQEARLGDLDLPKGSRIYFSQYLTHRTPELFPSPQRFMPDRWNGPEPPPFSYFPFGAGPRMCIGYTFSMTMMKTCLGLMLQRFRFSLVPGARIDRKVALTLSPRHGMPMTVHAQDHRFERRVPNGNIRDMVELGQRTGR